MKQKGATGPGSLGQLSVDMLRTRMVSDSCDPIDDPYPDNFLNSQPRMAAVLVPFLWLDGQWHVLFIRRTHVDGDIHSGQVAFPGGGAEPGDEDPVATALREANEEIRLQANDIEIIGRLPRLRTISNFVVTPVVGILDWPAELVPNPAEVSRIFTIPLAWLVDPDNRTIQNRELPKPFGAVEVIYFNEHQGEILWGASARIMQKIIETLLQVDGT
jgi:8-oxo-dGTP pyrophosphatase MutT (NUDIX family)